MTFANKATKHRPGRLFPMTKVARSFVTVAAVSLLAVFLFSSAGPTEQYTTKPVLSEKHHPETNMNKADSGGFRFEVFGRVQGVYFRKFTQKKANELGVTGWIRNNKPRGTVQGEVASKDSLARQQMKEWLQTVGSPQSSIEKAEFEDIDDSQRLSELLSLESFEVRKTVSR